MDTEYLFQPLHNAVGVPVPEALDEITAAVTAQLVPDAPQGALDIRRKHALEKAPVFPFQEHLRIAYHNYLFHMGILHETGADARTPFKAFSI